MQKISVGFSKPKSWKIFAEMIMLGYGIPYDHVYVKFWSEKYKRFMIYQASKTMVNFMSVDVFNEENIVVSEFDVQIEDDKHFAMVTFAIDKAGKKYGIKQCVGMAWVRANEIFGRYTENPFKDGGDTYVCSELAAYILENFAGVSIPKDIDDITPKDLYEYLNKVQASLVS